MSRILVTGATGFVGRALVQRLLERGHEVRAATRRPGAHLKGAQTVAVGEIGPHTEWAEALADIEVVIHLAARVHVMRDRATDPLAEFRQVNVEGTRRLAETSAERGVRRLVFLSSIKALVDESRPTPLTDATPPAPGSPYGRSKREAEQALADIGEAGALETVVLRPPLIYGPGVGGNLLRLMRALRRGLPLPLGGLGNRRTLLDNTALADALERAATHPAAAGRGYLVGDGHALSTPELIEALAMGLGVKARLVTAPVWLLGAAARLTGQAAAWDRLAGSLVVESRGIADELGWSPPSDPASGLRQTAEWFKACAG